MDLALNSALTVAGIVMLCYGGNWLVNGGVAIAKRFRMSNMLIGMTIVAYGTSTPELAASIAASDHSGIILGNVIGSNIANIGLVIGIAAILVPLVIQKSTLRKEIPIMLGFSLLLVGMSLDGEISQYDGALLIILLLGFTIYTYRDARLNKPKDGGGSAPPNLRIRSLALLGIGIVFLYFGAELTVDNAVLIAKHFDISERIIGITVIAIGTSLPELITSIIAIRKGHSNIGIGNIIGSNIYNILMIMGIASAIAGISVAQDVLFDYTVMILFSMALFLGLISRVINRKIGIGLLAAYAAYLVSGFLQ